MKSTRTLAEHNVESMNATRINDCEVVHGAAREWTPVSVMAQTNLQAELMEGDIIKERAVPFLHEKMAK